MKVAVVGSGPAGLTCRGDLSKSGYDIIVCERLHDGDDVLCHGIPEFRLPKQVLDIERDKLEKLGMKMAVKTPIGGPRTIHNICHKEFKEVFVGVGTALPIFPEIPGQNLNHIYCPCVQPLDYYPNEMVLSSTLSLSNSQTCSTVPSYPEQLNSNMPPAGQPRAGRRRAGAGGG
jgi:hypothetical protein